MKKKVFGKKLSRDRGSRRALFRSLIKALLEHGKITTTKAKAKAIQPDMEKLVSLAKTKDVSRMRQVYSYLANDKVSTERLFKLVTLNFSKRKSGFTRIVNLPRRQGDYAEIVRIEFTEMVQPEKQTKDKKEAESEKQDKVPEKPVKTTLKSRVTNMLKTRKKK